jgi:DnaK suppressor protein
MSQLNEQQLAQFKGLLNTQQAQIRSTIETIFSSSSHASHRLAVKKLTRLTNDELIECTQKVDNPTLHKNINNLKNIDASLSSLQQGMYGLCSDCETELTVALLESSPTTQRCPDCEAKYQKQSYNSYRL